MDEGIKFKGRHRGNSKVKYEHAMLPGLRELLESIQHWPEIQAINPGRISRTKPIGKSMLLIQYELQSGLKTIYKSGNGIQEVFFVSSDSWELHLKLLALDYKGIVVHKNPLYGRR